MTAPARWAEAFAGRRVFVTGDTGFKGSWLCLWLARLGAEVAGYAHGPPDPGTFVAAGVGDLLRDQHTADVLDLDVLSAAVSAADPDVVFHLAAQPLVRTGHAQPVETFATNIMGTVHLLEAVRRRNRPCAVVVVTSDKCYENVDQVWGYRESDPMGGADPYSASKGAAELVTAAYRRSYFSPESVGEHGVYVASARAGNVVGGGDWAEDRLIPDAVRAVTAGRVLEVRSPSSTRPWQHVLEPVSGYLELGARLLRCDASACTGWNFGPAPGDEASVGQLVDAFVQEWGEGRWKHVPPERPVHEAGQLRLAIDQARVGLGWRPRWGSAEMVRRTAQWYRAYYATGGDKPGAMRTVCYEDIDAYEAAMEDDR